MTSSLKTIAVEGRNSIEFLTKVFQHFDAGQLFTVQRAGIDLTQYPGLEVIQTQTPGETRGWGQLAFTPSHSDAPVQILFSSGTEGLPKAIVLSARNISDVVQRLNQVMGLDHSVREYVGVPVTYSFGLGRIRAVSAAGGKFFLPERFDPTEIREMLEAGEINAISAVPTLWRLILAAPDAIGAAGDRVRWIEIGSQYMSRSEKAALKQMFPNARIVQHYGLTEASRTSFLDVTAAPDQMLESVGTATAPAEIKIGPEDEICIRGDHVALGLLQGDGTIASLTDAQGWLHTKDKGDIRDGALYFLGRLDDQMNIAGVNLGAERLEQQIAALCGCDGLFAVTGIADPLRGDAVLLAIAPKAHDRLPVLKAAAELALKQSGIDQAGSLHITKVDALPLTGTGKVQRAKLRAEYSQDAPENAPAVDQGDDLTPAQQQVLEAWQSVVGPVPITATETFYDSGGDSLSAVQIGLVMERSFNRAATRATLEGRTLAEVADAQAGAATPHPDTESLPAGTVKSWALNATRGLMVLAVLFSHWGPGLFSRLRIEDQAERLLTVVYQMGTQGFATVFGIGLGYYFLADYPANKSTARRRLRSSFLLVLAGLTLMAVVRLTLFGLQGKPMDGYLVAIAFYNVLAYYVVALATARLWLDYLAGPRFVIAKALLVTVLVWPLLSVARHLMPDVTHSLLEWPRLMIVANYSYLQISSLVFAGIALGYWFAHQTDMRRAGGTMLAAGLFGMAIVLIVGFEVYAGRSFTSRSAPLFGGRTGLVFYFFFSSFLFGAMLLMVQIWGGLPRVIRFAMQALIVLGGLALPVYAFHGLVIPVKDILNILGLHGAAALALPVAVFVIWLGYSWWRLRRMYFN